MTSKLAVAEPKTLKSIITNHNKTILNKSETLSTKNGPVWIKTYAYYVNGECQAKNIICQASLNSSKLNYDKKYYKSNCETAFKKVFANHKKSFNNEQ